MNYIKSNLKKRILLSIVLIYGAEIEVIREDRVRVMVIASMSQNISLPQSVVELEAFAAVMVLKFSLEIGISFIILKGNFEVVINAFKDGSSLITSVGFLIRGVKIIAKSFHSVSFSHIHQDGNFVVPILLDK